MFLILVIDWIACNEVPYGFFFSYIRPRLDLRNRLRKHIIRHFIGCVSVFVLNCVKYSFLFSNNQKLLLWSINILFLIRFGWLLCDLRLIFWLFFWWLPLKIKMRTNDRNTYTISTIQHKCHHFGDDFFIFFF